MTAGDSCFLAQQLPARRPVRSTRSLLNYWTDVLMLLSAAVLFATALILLTHFHIGHGTFASSAFGISRLVWLNAHRFAAVVVLAGVGLHAWLHWQGIVVRVSRAFKGLPGGARRSDLVLYFGFALDLLAGFATWLLLPGSAPLSGPVKLGHLEPLRHLFVDIHNFAGLALLPAVVIHVAHHMRWIVRTSKELLLPATGPEKLCSRTRTLCK